MKKYKKQNRYIVSNVYRHAQAVFLIVFTLLLPIIFRFLHETFDNPNFYFVPEFRNNTFFQRAANE